MRNSLHLGFKMHFAIFFALVCSVVQASQPIDKKPKVEYKAGDAIQIAVSSVDVRVGTKTVATASKGETYDVLEVRNDWIAIKVGDVRGWIRSNTVDKASAPPPVPTPDPTPKPAPPRPTPPKNTGTGVAEKGDRYALLVGVKEYDATELKSLKYSEGDIESLAEVLPSLGYAESNTVVLTQKRGAKRNRFSPTATHIRKEIELLLSEAQPEDTVLVALAGHGVQFSGEKDSFFCASDAKLEDRTTLVSLEEVYAAMKKCKAESKIVLIDACRNDPVSALARSRDTVKLESVTRPQAQAPPGGVAVLFSCSAGQQAFEHPDLEHGIFFHYVIEGLKGTADFDKDGEITLAELEQFTGKQVQRFVRKELAQRQVPERRGEARGLLPLGRLRQSSSQSDQP